jgi:N-methylhydantoinase A
VRGRLGVDIGGTFTDAVLVDSSGAFSIDKVLTTPDDPSLGFIETVRRLVRRQRLDPELVDAIIHATTVATNALLERRGANTALLITQGFRDILEIGRQVRYELYNLQTEKPPPLVPRQLCFEVPERLDYRGEVVIPLSEEGVVRVAEELRAQAIRNLKPASWSIAICFLHAYRNPMHERRAAEILRRVYPEAHISLSSEVAPEMREYSRASTTVTNAYIRPIVDRYLVNVERRLRDEGFETPLQVMQSSGGTMSAASARERPITMLESGPAAGVTAAAFVAGVTGFPEAISFDMGGTTAKVGLIRGGRPSVRGEFEAGSVAGSGVGLARGSGYPILAPVMDLVEVGAGGGSVAWIDPGGLLRVGPRSAGADPGPACYGRGGADPTVTDANLVLGRLDPDRFLGGELRLDSEAARQAIDERCARPLKVSVLEAAMGIVDIANAAMVGAMRLVSVQRGYDPRDFALVAFGGAGPIHASQLAAELGIPSVIVPASPGVASALGMLATNVRHDYRATRLQPLAETLPDELEASLSELERQAVYGLNAEGFPPERISLQRSLDLRYVGQSWKLAVALPPGRLSSDHIAALKQQFDRQHEQQYGYHVAEEPVEIVNISVSALGLIPSLTLRDVPSGSVSPDAACIDKRAVYFREPANRSQIAPGYIDTPIYDRYRLVQGNIVEGPAVIVETDATTVLQPGYSAQVGRFGILLIRRTDARSDSNPPNTVTRPSGRHDT